MGKKSKPKTTQTYDPVASKKMSEIAERQQEMSEEQWSLYKDYFQDYEISAAQARDELLPYVSDVSKKLYSEALEGVSVEKRADEAGAAVTSAMRSERKSQPRVMSRYGIDPGSSRFRTGLEETGVKAAELTAGARNRATEIAEGESFARLGGALGMRSAAEGPQADPARRAMMSSSAAASTYAPLASRVLSTTQSGTGSTFWDFAGQALGKTVAAFSGSYAGAKGAQAATG